MIARRSALAALLLFPAAARAHSERRGSHPAHGARLSLPPAKTVLRFNEKVQLTALTARDGAGREMRVVLPRDTTPRSEERLAAPTLAAGTWRMEWRASFTVAGPP